jgi:hypothetical protein
MNERGPSMVDHRARRAGTIDFCPALNIFFPNPTLFHFALSPPPSKLDRQSCRVACLLICVSGED